MGNKIETTILSPKDFGFNEAVTMRELFSVLPLSRFGSCVEPIDFEFGWAVSQQYKKEIRNGRYFIIMKSMARDVVRQYLPHDHLIFRKKNL